MVPHAATVYYFPCSFPQKLGMDSLAKGRNLAHVIYLQQWQASYQEISTQLHLGDGHYYRCAGEENIEVSTE